MHDTPSARAVNAADQDANRFVGMRCVLLEDVGRRHLGDGHKLEAVGRVEACGQHLSLVVPDIPWLKQLPSPAVLALDRIAVNHDELDRRQSGIRRMQHDLDEILEQVRTRPASADQGKRDRQERHPKRQGWCEIKEAHGCLRQKRLGTGRGR